MEAAETFQESPKIRERFGELHKPLTPQAAVVESNRCLYCFDAPCMIACPTHIDVPGFIKRIASGNLRGSGRRILEANVLAASCARVCPVEVLCEGACVLHRQEQRPIAIGLLQRHAMEAFHRSGEPLLMKAPPAIDLRVACIGAGPASLACAAELCRHGASVTVFDSRALPGGLNTYGVADYKLPTAESLREVEMIRAMGVKFELQTTIETAASLEELEADYDCIFVGVGLGAMQRLDIAGEEEWDSTVPMKETCGVLNALQLISAYKTGHIVQMHGPVIVVGAGNTAVDAAIAARRLGADPVTMLYRRGPEDVSAFDFELNHARAEGVQFLWNHLPVAMRGDGIGGILLDIQAVRPVAGGFERVPGTVITLPCQTVIPAIGQSPLASLLSEFRHVALEKGVVVIDRGTGRTTNAKYYAGGDCANGGREVVDAVADGKRAALGMLQAWSAGTTGSELAHA